MKTNDKLAVIDYTERFWGGGRYGGSGDGEPRRIKLRCNTIPEALFWIFGGRELGDLERIVYGWAADGRPAILSIEGKFLDTAEGWLEDLRVEIGEGGGAATDIEEVGERERAYSEDILSFLGLSG